MSILERRQSEEVEAKLLQAQAEKEAMSKNMQIMKEAGMNNQRQYQQQLNASVEREKQAKPSLAEYEAMKSCEEDIDSEALHLARAGKNCCVEIVFNMPSKFNGTFQPDCQANCVSESLKALVNMILEGPSIKKTAVEENPVEENPSKMTC
ncbi:hypothetical protein OS493_004498 [Desmophyllum pertusum]|uniref:Uncharacterized protein n=1 Tax=Desmophyllum pertusum TaxID=174260 RepID=A0A9W9ZFR4_9CNID|nr:hypothetical protein OS493_004498 [Desmophyllum pertusum]